MALRLLFLGPLYRDFILPPQGRPALDIPGGDVIYAAVGAALWGAQVGLISRVGENFPRAWLEDWVRLGWDVRGVRILPQKVEHRRVLAYEPGFRLSGSSVAGAFFQRGLPFPKALMDYEPSVLAPIHPDRLTETTLRMSDLPSGLDDVQGAHLAPQDWVTHTLIPAALRQAGIPTITLDPTGGYMTPEWRNRIPMLLQGLTAFLPSEDELRRLFAHRLLDIWEMVEGLATWGVEMVVVKRGAAGHLLYEKSTGRRWEIPAYPAEVRDPTGAGSAFCGGFLAGWVQTYDAVEAALYGAVAASIVVERVGALAALDTLPGLAASRLERLRSRVRRV